MSSNTQQPRIAPKARIWILIGLCIFAGLLWGANWYFVGTRITDAAKQGQFGDMFGAVNALFTALAFAGLIYTVLLQRDQLALQQQEIIESGETQKQLVAEQIEAQRQLFAQQVEHDLKLEQLRQDFEKLAEQSRKAREDMADSRFARNVVAAIRRELEALGQIYDQGIGARLRPLVDGQIFEERLALTQDWFTVFDANAVHLGKIPADVSRRIISIYALMKGLIEEFRINNGYLADRAEIDFQILHREGEQHLKVKKEVIRQWLVAQAIKIRRVDAALKAAVAELYEVLDKSEIR